MKSISDIEETATDLIIYFLIVDVRESRCYITVEEKGGKRRCSQDIGSPVTKATCCCSVGKAWGGRCESCPLNGTEEFQHLCPGGFGYRPNTTTVRLKFFFLSVK